jgi:predicted TPR repeat methyltransferase
MTQTMNAALHDAYAADYDAQVLACDCYIADLLFGLCYEYTRPGRRLLDAGIGTGLSAQLFAQAGLEVHGMDFAPTMLDICRAKGFAAGLQLHDIRQAPWPHPSGDFECVVCCGVFHFIPELDGIFVEVTRVTAAGGVFAFTTKLPSASGLSGQPCEQARVGEFEIYAHSRAYVEALLARHALARLKTQKCFVGDDLFLLWVAGKR